MISIYIKHKKLGAQFRLKKDSGAGWKKTPVRVRYSEFFVISKNDYLVQHGQTVASDILGYSYVEYLLQGPYWGNAQFSPGFGTHSFQFEFRVLHNIKGVFRTISNIYDEAISKKYLTVFSGCIFAEMLHHRYLKGFCIRLCCLVFLYMFPLSSIGYLNEQYEHFVIVTLLLSSRDVN